ncbi:uncharacterized protein METZ01_LOCUS397193, partial [marine metagenome]
MRQQAQQNDSDDQQHDPADNWRGLIGHELAYGAENTGSDDGPSDGAGAAGY